MIVLDSSAVLAVALKEAGTARVLAALPQALMSAANLAEMLTVAERKGADGEGTFADVTALGLQIVAVETRHARIAAQIWRAHSSLNLSLGDRLCIALALDIGADILTSDREMTKVGMGTNVELFR